MTEFSCLHLLCTAFFIKRTPRKHSYKLKRKKSLRSLNTCKMRGWISPRPKVEGRCLTFSFSCLSGMFMATCRPMAFRASTKCDAPGRHWGEWSHFFVASCTFYWFSNYWFSKSRAVLQSASVPPFPKAVKPTVQFCLKRNSNPWAFSW